VWEKGPRFRGKKGKKRTWWRRKICFTQQKLSAAKGAGAGRLSNILRAPKNLKGSRILEGKIENKVSREKD